MGKLHEVIAVESGLKKQVEALKTDTQKAFDSRNAAYSGFSKTYAPDDENDKEVRNPEGKPVGYTVQKKIGYFREFLARMIDCQFQKECANQAAKADIVLAVDDGAESNLTIAKDVPVTMLLNLETQLTNLRATLEAAPTLDPNFSWIWNENEGCWATTPVSKRVSRKVTKPIVLFPATDKHPAQTQLISEDIQVGTLTEITKSGALSVKQKAEIMTKLDVMLSAVKRARMKANDTEVPTGKIAKGIFDYILNV